MKVNELRAEVVRNGMSMEELSEEIGIDRSTLYRRLNKPNSFTLGEIISISKALDLTSDRVVDIFFSEKVS